MIFIKRKCLCTRVKLLKPGPVVMEPADFSGNTVRDFKQAHKHAFVHNNEQIPVHCYLTSIKICICVHAIEGRGRVKFCVSWSS